MLSILIFAFCLMLCDCDEKVDKEISEENVFDPDMLRNVSELISSKGYPVEEHSTTSSDGYILSIQRIPYGKKSYFSNEKKRVILLVHGILDSAAAWVLNFPEQSLGFILADKGFDVWLANTRGNRYSRKHKKYKTHQTEIWDFSFDEMAKYDLPAMIDYALNTTKQSTLYCIAHSQGTSATFALLSENPKYNKKIKLFIALAPVTTLQFLSSPLKYIVPFAEGIASLVQIMDSGEFFPDSLLMKHIKNQLCASKETFMCENLLSLIMGKDKEQLNVTRLGVYSAHFPCSSSVKSILHFAQIIKSGKFCKFDYGSHNMEYYQQETPPEYDVSHITTPVALIWSKNDKLSDAKDVEILEGKLKSLVDSYCVPYPLFAHQDFTLALDASKLVYDHVLSLLDQY